MARDRAVCWNQVSALIGERLGLYFPDDRLTELRRGLNHAADELGLADEAECAQRLIATKLDDAQVGVVASHLTIGETYFFRGEETFAALADHVLPALVAARLRGEKRLRIWSAGCCTGEEAYSLAILLRQLLPDIDDWQISILATDINRKFLRKARDGVYGQWSFRGTPAGFRERYFQPASTGRHALAAHIKRMVTFAPLNLVENVFPSVATATNAMDLILCRNVLMYFTAAQAASVVAKLHRSLREDGWLVVAPCEVSQTLFSRFVPRTVGGAILYQRRSDASVHAPCPRAAVVRAPAPMPAPATTAPTLAMPVATSAPAHRRHRRRLAKSHADAPATGRANTLQGVAAEVRSVSARARTLADQGRLSEALVWCEHWIASDKMDAGAHYLHAMVLIELGELTQARVALQRSAYLEPGTAMTCFTQANLERSLGQHEAAARHYRNTLGLLECEPPDAELRHSEGVSAAQLAALVRDLLAAEHMHEHD